MTVVPGPKLERIHLGVASQSKRRGVRDDKVHRLGSGNIVCNLVVGQATDAEF